MEGNNSGGAVASIVTMGSKLNVVVEVSLHVVKRFFLANLSERNNINVARRRPKSAFSVLVFKISLIGSIESRQRAAEVAKVVGSFN